MRLNEYIGTENDKSIILIRFLVGDGYPDRVSCYSCRTRRACDCSKTEKPGLSESV